MKENIEKKLSNLEERLIEFIDNQKKFNEALSYANLSFFTIPREKELDISDYFSISELVNNPKIEQEKLENLVTIICHQLNYTIVKNQVYLYPKIAIEKALFLTNQLNSK